MPATPKKQIQRFQALPFDFLSCESQPAWTGHWIHDWRFQLPQIIGESGYEKPQETGCSKPKLFETTNQNQVNLGIQEGNLPKVSCSKPSSEPNKPPKHLGRSSFGVRHGKHGKRLRSQDLWALGKDGKGLSKTGCNWQTPRMFGLLPNNIGYTSGILTKHRYYGYILGIPAGTYPLVYFYILMVGTRLREQYGGHWGGGACASRIGWLTNEWYNDIYIYICTVYIYIHIIEWPTIWSKWVPLKRSGRDPIIRSPSSIPKEKLLGFSRKRVLSRLRCPSRKNGVQ